MVPSFLRRIGVTARGFPSPTVKNVSAMTSLPYSRDNVAPSPAVRAQRIGGRFLLRSTVMGWPRCATVSLIVAMTPGSIDGVVAQEPAPVRCGVEMRNVRLHLADDVVLAVRSLDGEFISEARGVPPVFDDPRSYTLRMRSADLAMDTASLTALIARALGSGTAPVRDVTVTIEKGALQVRGTLKKGVSVPFSMQAEVSAAPDGSMRLHAKSLKAVGVPVKGLLDLVGVDIADLMKAPAGSGIRAEGDDLLIDTTAILPPPRTEGRLQQVAIAGQRLTMRMTGAASPPARPATLPLPRGRNYLYFFGGSIRFGKLTMSDADMQLIDADPRDPFEFFPARYEAQLIAGYSRNTPRKGLQVFMPDYVAKGGAPLPPPR